jgi:hypothetical protein
MHPSETGALMCARLSCARSDASGPFGYANNPTQYSWSNGDVVSTAANTTAGVWFGGPTGATATIAVNVTALPGGVCIQSPCSAIAFVGAWGASAAIHVSAQFYTSSGPVTSEQSSDFVFGWVDLIERTLRQLSTRMQSNRPQKRPSILRSP